MELVLALDAGTTGVRAVAFDERLGVVDDAYREVTQHFPAPGEVEHDAREIAALAVATLAEVAERQRSAGHRVAAVGITNQRETTVGFDRDGGEPFSRALVWQDRRTAVSCGDLAAAGHGPLVRATTGLVLDPYFSATKMRWLLESGRADAARRPALATVDSWLVWTLTGGADGDVYVTEPSNASRTLLMDLETLDWSPPMARLFGVDAAVLATVRPSAGPFGEVSGDVVAALAGVPITGVLGDQQAALFGQACFRTGQVKATYGTGAFVLANAGETVPRVVDGLVTTVAWDLGAFGPATYALEGSAFVAGAAVSWLADVGLLERPGALEELARSVPDAAGVRFVPAFTGLGSPFWNPAARGALTGLSRGVGRGEVARALVEGLAFQVRAMTDAFAAGGVVLNELRADGGVAAMDLLLELQATNSRVSVARSATLEATARGAAGVAGLEVGLWGSLEEIGALWRAVRTFEPGEPTAADAGYAAWLRAAERA